MAGELPGSPCPGVSRAGSPSGSSSRCPPAPTGRSRERGAGGAPAHLFSSTRTFSFRAFCCSLSCWFLAHSSSTRRASLWETPQVGGGPSPGPGRGPVGPVPWGLPCEGDLARAMLNPAHRSARSSPRVTSVSSTRPATELQPVGDVGTRGHGGTGTRGHGGTGTWGNRLPQDSKSQMDVPDSRHGRTPPVPRGPAQPREGVHSLCGRGVQPWLRQPLEARCGPAVLPAPPSRASASPCVLWVVAPWGVRGEVSRHPHLSPLGQGLSRLTGTSLS